MHKPPAAARRLYDEDPTLFAHAKDQNDPDRFVDSRAVELLMQQSSALIKPGTRAGEGALDDDEKEALTEASTKQGEAVFEEFKAWVGMGRS